MSEPILSKVDLTLGKTSTDCRIVVNGVDISNRTYKVEVVAEVGELTKVIIHTQMLDVTALGDAYVQYTITPREAKPVNDAVAANEEADL